MLTDNNILNSHQYGFHTGYSKDLALRKFIANIIDSLEEKKPSIASCINLTKAFSCINHQILIQKSPLHGIKGTTLNWISSYLNEHYQHVKIKNTTSEPLLIRSGVPQDPIMSPVLISIYINDIFLLTNEFDTTLILHADNTTCLISANTIDLALSKLKEFLGIIHRWFQANRHIRHFFFRIFHTVQAYGQHVEKLD